jgi:hypothetical protein
MLLMMRMIEVNADEFMSREEAKQLLEKSKNWDTFPNLETARKVYLARLNIEFSEMVDHTKACVSIRIPKPDAKTRKENVVNQSDTRWKPFMKRKINLLMLEKFKRLLMKWMGNTLDIRS